jgi:transcriptional regulator with PAS, ATPase and Fis domain
MEAELFGYERGAFTGAEASKPGRLELAHRGTVFFDEVGELELALQAKLLRVLQEGELQRIGSVKTLKVDVRVIAASNQDLEALVAQGRFREDLYYRLNVLPLRVPPLRERPEDIPLLAEHFLAKYTRELKTGPKELSQEALRCLLGHRWKGNVRELQNAIERAVILCDGGLIMPEHLGLEGTPSRQEVETLQEVARSAQRAAEAEHIRQALARTGGNKSKAAELLGVSYKTLLSKLKDYGIE